MRMTKSEPAWPIARYGVWTRGISIQKKRAKLRFPKKKWQSLKKDLCKWVGWIWHAGYTVFKLQKASIRAQLCSQFWFLKKNSYCEFYMKGTINYHYLSIFCINQKKIKYVLPSLSRSNECPLRHGFKLETNYIQTKKLCMKKNWGLVRAIGGVVPGWSKISDPLIEA